MRDTVSSTGAVKRAAVSEVVRVLGQLYDRGETFCAAEELLTSGAGPWPRGGVGRGRLEGVLAALRERGHAIEVSPSRGLRLARPVRLDAALIERGLSTRRVGRNVLCFQEVGSTNDVAFDAARQQGADGLVVLAEHQSRGRGRHGRSWISPPGANLLMSVLLTDLPESRPVHEPLTIAAGVAAAEGIEETTGLRCLLKWPNDVLLEGGKVCGILVEVRLRARRPRVVIGMGINVHACPPPNETDAPATCLAEHLRRPVERIDLARAVLRRLDRWVGRVWAGRTRPLKEAWLSRCGMLNERVTVLCAGRRHTGRVLDVSPLEGLFLAGDDGRILHLPARNATIVVPDRR